jgi:hypothetical protein
MSHITKQFFEGHEVYDDFIETTTFLGINMDAWKFADGTENILDDVEYLHVVFEPTDDTQYNLSVVFVNDSGGWQIQEIHNNPLC